MTTEVLAGKRCLIVGAGSGIGRAVAKSFAGSGARVAALELDAAKADGLAAAQPEALVHTGDASSWDDAVGLVDHAVASFGGIDVVVTCVGLFDYYRGLAELTPEQLADGLVEAVDANVKSHLVPIRAALDALRQSRGTAILTLSTSSFGPGRGGVLYVTTKFALRGAMTALAHELAPDVRVNAVAPGGTAGTDLRGLHSLGLHDRSLGTEPDRATSIAERSPLEFAHDAADVAASYVFLASAGAAAMTGRVLHPDGGANLA